MKNLFLIAFALVSFSSAYGHRPLDDFENCKPNLQDCINTVCEKLGAFDCQTTQQLQAVGNACSGNLNGSCIEAACNHLGAFGCNTSKNVFTVADACRGNYGATCLEAVCNRIGAFGCNSLTEIVTVAQSCASEK